MEESEVAGFFVFPHIHMVGQVRVNGRDAVPNWSYADPDPPNLVNADPDPSQ